MLYELMSEQTVLTLSCPYKKLMIQLSVHFHVSIKKNHNTFTKKSILSSLFLSFHAILYLRVLLWSLMPCLAVLISKNNSKLKLFAVGWVASRLHGGRHVDVVMNSAHRTRWFFKERKWGTGLWFFKSRFFFKFQVGWKSKFWFLCFNYFCRYPKKIIQFTKR